MWRRGIEQDVGRRARRDVAERDDQVVVVEPVGRDRPGGDLAEQAVGDPPSRPSDPPASSARHQSTGFELIRNPIVPTSPAIRYDT